MTANNTGPTLDIDTFTSDIVTFTPDIAGRPHTSWRAVVDYNNLSNHLIATGYKACSIATRVTG